MLTPNHLCVRILLSPEHIDPEDQYTIVYHRDNFGEQWSKFHIPPSVLDLGDVDDVREELLIALFECNIPSSLYWVESGQAVRIGDTNIELYIYMNKK